MRAAVESYLNKIWYGNRPVPFYLRWLESLYRTLQRRRPPVQRASNLPTSVIVVGNLTAGGAGKTPLLIALVQRAKARGMRVGVVSAGYGRSTSALLQVDAQSNWREVGDEPLLIAKRCAVPVCVAAKRSDAVRALSQSCDLIFADDGLQNPDLARGAEALVIDGVRGFGNARLLPAGPLRQDVQDYRARFPIRVLNGAEPNPVRTECIDADAWQMQLVGQTLQRLDAKSQSDLASWSGRKVRALAGIGNPQRFFDVLRAAGLQLVEMQAADHAVVTLSQGDSPIVMTEKDALKYASASDKPLDFAWYLPVDAQITRPQSPPYTETVRTDDRSGVDALLDALLAQSNSASAG